jgi:hypothetical protein
LLSAWAAAYFGALTDIVASASTITGKTSLGLRRASGVIFTGEFCFLFLLKGDFKVLLQNLFSFMSKS